MTRLIFFSEFRSDSTVVQSNKLNFRTCMGYGTAYYRTFDGKEFSFAGRCSYVLVSDDQLLIEVKNIDCDKYSTCKKVSL